MSKNNNSKDFDKGYKKGFRSGVLLSIFVTFAYQVASDIYEKMDHHDEPQTTNTVAQVIQGSEPLDSPQIYQSDDNVRNLIEKLLVMGSNEIVITLGKRGCLVSCEGGIEHIPALQVDAVDPTAAGDTFLGYYVASRVKNVSGAKSATYASKAAAMCVQARGAADSIPTHDKLQIAIN